MTFSKYGKEALLLFVAIAKSIIKGLFSIRSITVTKELDIQGDNTRVIVFMERNKNK